MRNIASQFTASERKALGIALVIFAFSAMLLSASVVVRSLSRLSLALQPAPTAPSQPTALRYPTLPPEWTRIPDNESPLNSIAPSGLGVTRSRIQSSFEKLGFSFESALNVSGRPSVFGTSQDRLVLVQLFGRPENLGSVPVTCDAYFSPH